jgi:hypothetical protein
MMTVIFWIFGFASHRRERMARRTLLPPEVACGGAASVKTGSVRYVVVKDERVRQCGTGSGR